MSPSPFDTWHHSSTSRKIVCPLSRTVRNAPRRGIIGMSGSLLQQDTGKASIDPVMFSKYMSIPLEEKGDIMAEYCWIDAVGGVRSKTRTLPLSKLAKGAVGLPEWNYDGSSTDQAPGDDSEVIMKPRALFKDPFRLGNHVMVMCDTYTPAGVALPTNTRAPAADAFKGKEDEEPWFGLEQEYTLFNLDQTTPLGWPKGGFVRLRLYAYTCTQTPN